MISHPYEYYGTCTRVIDGDTVEINLDLGLKITHVIRVRLLDVDAPEIFSGLPDERARGMIVKSYLESIVLNKSVKLKTIKDSTSFNRFLATLWVEDKNGTVINVNEFTTAYIKENGL